MLHAALHASLPSRSGPGGVGEGQLRSTALPIELHSPKSVLLLSSFPRTHDFAPPPRWTIRGGDLCARSPASTRLVLCHAIRWAAAAQWCSASHACVLVLVCALPAMSDPRQLPATPIARTRTTTAHHHRRGTAASDHHHLPLHYSAPSVSNRTAAASRSGLRSAYWPQHTGSGSHTSPRTIVPLHSSSTTTTPSRPHGLPPRPPTAYPAAADSDPDRTPRKTDNFPTPPPSAPPFSPALTRSCQNLRAQAKWRRKSEQLDHSPSVAHRHSLSEAFFTGYESNSSSGSGSSMSEELARRRSGRASTSNVPSSVSMKQQGATE